MISKVKYIKKSRVREICMHGSVRGESQCKGGIQMKVAESLEAVHTHTHTHTILTKLCAYLLYLQCNGGIRLLEYISIFLPKDQNKKYMLIKAYRKISLVLYVKNKIGYINEICNKYISNEMKKIKLLHDSLSFL